MKRLIFFLLAILYNWHLSAQDTIDAARTIQLIRGIQSSIPLKPVSFEMAYTYANEHHPTVLLDSLHGFVEMDSCNYHCILDSTETIRNSQYNIILFKEDKLMYLAASNNNLSQNDPFQTMQTFMEKAINSKCSVTNNNSKVIAHFVFAEDAPCKELTITVDTVARRLISLSYIIKTSLLMESVGDDVPEDYEPYALVRVSFYNYKSFRKNPAMYDDKNYFYKDGTAFKVAPSYEDYTIFVGTPGL